MVASAERYPLSSPREDSIPFDVGFPYGLMNVAIGVAASAPLSLPPDAVLAVLYASCDCIISFGPLAPSALTTEGVFLEESVFVPAGGMLTIQVPDLFFSCISADGVTTGKLRVCLFKPWQGMGKELLGSYM